MHEGSPYSNTLESSFQGVFEYSSGVSDQHAEQLCQEYNAYVASHSPIGVSDTAPSRLMSISEDDSDTSLSSASDLSSSDESAPSRESSSTEPEENDRFLTLQQVQALIQHCRSIPITPSGTLQSKPGEPLRFVARLLDVMKHLQTDSKIPWDEGEAMRAEYFRRHMADYIELFGGFKPEAGLGILWSNMRVGATRAAEISQGNDFGSLPAGKVFNGLTECLAEHGFMNYFNDFCYTMYSGLSRELVSNLSLEHDVTMCSPGLSQKWAGGIGLSEGELMSQNIFWEHELQVLRERGFRDDQLHVMTLRDERKAEFEPLNEAVRTLEVQQRSIAQKLHEIRREQRALRKKGARKRKQAGSKRIRRHHSLSRQESIKQKKSSALARAKSFEEREAVLNAEFDALVQQSTRVEATLRNANLALDKWINESQDDAWETKPLMQATFSQKLEGLEDKPQQQPSLHEDPTQILRQCSAEHEALRSRSSSPSLDREPSRSLSELSAEHAELRSRSSSPSVGNDAKPTPSLSMQRLKEKVQGPIQRARERLAKKSTTTTKPGSGKK